MKAIAKVPFVGLLLCGFALGQETPASARLSHMALRMDVVHRAAEQTDPTPELEKVCDEIGPRLTGSMA
jgi:hypothetical protein